MQPKVRFFGDIAIVTGVLSLEGSREGFKPGARLFADVFIKRDGRWQVVSSQATLVPAK